MEDGQVYFIGSLHCELKRLIPNGVTRSGFDRAFAQMDIIDVNCNIRVNGGLFGFPKGHMPALDVGRF